MQAVLGEHSVVKILPQLVPNPSLSTIPIFDDPCFTAPKVRGTSNSISETIFFMKRLIQSSLVS